MPAFLEATTNNPYVISASVQRSPSADGAGRVGPPAAHLSSILLHVVQSSPEIVTERAGAIPYVPFSMTTVGGAQDIIVDDYIVVSAGPFAGTFRVRGANAFGLDHTLITCERIVGI